MGDRVESHLSGDQTAAAHRQRHPIGIEAEEDELFGTRREARQSGVVRGKEHNFCIEKCKKLDFFHYFYV